MPKHGFQIGSVSKRLWMIICTSEMTGVHIRMSQNCLGLQMNDFLNHYTYESLLTCRVIINQSWSTKGLCSKWFDNEFGKRNIVMYDSILSISVEKNTILGR